MKQFRIVYTVNGKGYDKNEPWIFDDTNDEDEAQVFLAEADEYLSTHYKEYEVWVEMREVSPWQRVDLC